MSSSISSMSTASRRRFSSQATGLRNIPEYVKKIVERGHEIGNHSFEHPHLNSLSKEQIRSDLKRNHDLIKELTGTDSFLFRPPFGEYSNKVIEVAEELGYFTIQWSIDSLDWKDVSADFMVGRIMEKAGPGEIVLFHNAGRHTPAGGAHPPATAQSGGL